MKVRGISWYRTEGERRSSNLRVLAFRMYESLKQPRYWFQYSFLDSSGNHILTREEFEKLYLGWTDHNEG